MKEIVFLILFIWLKKICFRFKYSTGKNFRNNLINFIIFKRRQFFLQIEENISVSRITSMYYATTQTFISLNQRKKTIKKFLQIKETMLWAYSYAQICLIQRNFVWIKETFFWVWNITRHLWIIGGCHWVIKGW